MNLFLESQQYIDQAEAYAKAGDRQQAQQAYYKAAILQRTFVKNSCTDLVRTRAIFGLSAATLFFKACAFDEAESLAQELLMDPELDSFELRTARKLRLLLEEIEDARADRTRGRREFLYQVPTAMANWSLADLRAAAKVGLLLGGDNLLVDRDLVAAWYDDERHYSGLIDIGGNQ